MNPGIDAYRIGGGTHRPHWAHRWHADRWFRSWQAEWAPDCMWAPRAWTKAGVIRKARRWRRRGADIARHERRYGPAPAVRGLRAEYLAA